MGDIEIPFGYLNNIIFHRGKLILPGLPLRQNLMAINQFIDTNYLARMTMYSFIGPCCVRQSFVCL